MDRPQYSESYWEEEPDGDSYEYIEVRVPRRRGRGGPPDGKLSPREWRALGIDLSEEWDHEETDETSERRYYVLTFRR
jgi:hypothetical protein